MAPLTDAVRLVDRKNFHLQLFNQRLEIGREKALRRDIKQALEAVMQLLDRLALLAGAERAVDQGRGDSRVAQLLHLVFHQRD